MDPKAMNFPDVNTPHLILTITPLILYVPPGIVGVVIGTHNSTRVNDGKKGLKYFPDEQKARHEQKRGGGRRRVCRASPHLSYDEKEGREGEKEGGDIEWDERQTKKTRTTKQPANRSS